MTDLSSATDETVPAGFSTLTISSPFGRQFEPVYRRQDGDRYTIGLWVKDKHLNHAGVTHGGLLLALADVALSHVVGQQIGPLWRLATVSFSADFIGSVDVGRWIELNAEIPLIKGAHIFANGYVFCDELQVLRCSAVFLRKRC